MSVYLSVTFVYLYVTFVYLSVTSVYLSVTFSSKAQFLLNLIYICLRTVKNMSWTIGPKPVDQNDVFTIRPKYNHKAENRRAKMMIRPKNFISHLYLNLCL